MPNLKSVLLSILAGILILVAIIFFKKVINPPNKTNEKNPIIIENEPPVGAKYKITVGIDVFFADSIKNSGNCIEFYKCGETDKSIICNKEIVVEPIN